jgi:hypothetical protein
MPSEQPATPLDFGGHLQLLGYTVGQFVAIGHDDPTLKLPWYTVVRDPVDAPAYVDQLPDTANVFFTVCPTKGPARDGGGRGTEDDATRLSALWADLDVKPGACADLTVAHSIIGDLTSAVGSRPSAIVESGGGLHPYWPVCDGWIKGGDIGPARALIRRWGRLVAAVAKDHGAEVDNVFELARMLRVPGTFNNKFFRWRDGHPGRRPHRPRRPATVVRRDRPATSRSRCPRSRRRYDSAVHRGRVDAVGMDVLERHVLVRRRTRRRAAR